MTNESGLREKITTLIDDSESNIYWAVEMGRTFDKKLLVDQIIALISPAGEVVVPVRPTPRMIRTGTEALHGPRNASDRSSSQWVTWDDEIEAVYRAMLSAAPRGMEG